MSAQGLVCFWLRLRQVTGNGRLGSAECSLLPGEAATSIREDVEEVYVKVRFVFWMEKGHKLKCLSSVKHFCLGFGCPYFSGFRLGEGCCLLCFALLTILIPNHSLFPVRENFKVINCHHGFKVPKECSSEEELMMFLQLQGFGKALG